MSRINSYPRYLLCALIAISGFFISAPLVRAALIDINTAGIEELDTLDGIGPAYAQRIIDYRITNGSFQSIEEIKNVSGIGDSTFAKIKNSITVGGGTSQTQSTDSTTYSAESAHYVSLPIAEEVEDDGIKLSAGGDRIVVAGTPVEFRVKTNKPVTKQNNFSWNFGDGVVGGGYIVSHTYQYPGDYIVVLNANFSSDEAVTRVRVKVTEPELTITTVGIDRIEIRNDSKYEVNLFGRALISGDKAFVFPKDTIVGAGQKISLSSKVTGLTGPFITDTVISVLEEGNLQKDVQKKIELNKIAKISEIKNNIANLEKTVASLGYVESGESELKKEKVALMQEAVTPQLGLVVQSVPDKKGGLLRILKRFFLNKND